MYFEQAPNCTMCTQIVCTTILEPIICIPCLATILIVDCQQVPLPWCNNSRTQTKSITCKTVWFEEAAICCLHSFLVTNGHLSDGDTWNYFPFLRINLLCEESASLMNWALHNHIVSFHTDFLHATASTGFVSFWWMESDQNIPVYTTTQKSCWLSRFFLLVHENKGFFALFSEYFNRKSLDCNLWLTV